MFRAITILFGILLITTISSCTSENLESPQAILERKMRPSDHVFQMRSYPYSAPDARKVKETEQRAMEDAANPARSADHPWTLQGPTNIGGRINTVAIHPSNDDIMYAGNCTGGVFKTVDGGVNWQPITDELDHLPIAHIVFAPSDPNTVLVATGDPNISGFPHPGGGVYQSTDGGDTWQQLGLEEMGVVSKVAYDTSEENTLYAGAMGIPFVRNNDRGLYKSTDGGATWEQSLFIDNETGISEIKIDYNNPSTIYAAGWTRIRNNEESLITGPKTRIYRSNDAGATWDTLTVGLPEGPQTRIGLEMSQNDPNTLWALYVGADFAVQGIYKTTDGGDTWTNLYDGFSLFDALGGFGWYFAKIRVNPWDEDEISVLGVDLWTSFDNGGNWEMTTPPWWEYTVHADKHDMVYLSEDEVVLATDGGLYKTTNHFATWSDIDNIPNTQFYRIALNPWDLSRYTGGAQDNGTTTGNEDEINVWNRDYGGDGFQAIYDPVQQGLKYMETQNGNIVFSQDGFVEGFTNGIDPEDRTNWDTPYIMSHHDNEVFYTGTYRVYQNTSAPWGWWEPISEDLTDGNIFGNSFHTISAVEESPINPDIIYVGTTDGNVWKGIHEDGEWDWIDIYTGTDLPDRWVTCIRASEEDDQRVWVTVSGYRENDSESHVYRSDDGGESWISVAGDFPDQPLNHIETINDSILFVAGDHGVYYTTSEGENWERVGNNMPIIPVLDIEIDTVNHVLVAGSFARGIYTFPIDSLFTWPVEEVEEEPINVLELETEELQFYPNPTNALLTIEGQSGAVLTIYDMNGRIALQSTLTNQRQQHDVGRLKSGKYVMVVQKDDTILTDSFVKF